MDMLSDGDLYRLQQQAIEQARQTARKSQEPPAQPKESKPKLLDLLNLKNNENLLLLGIALLLITDGCDDQILLLALAFLLFKK